MEALVVVASEERKSIRVPGWLLERGWVAGGFRYQCWESGCVGFARWVIARGIGVGIGGGLAVGERSTVMAVKVAGGQEVLERGGGER